MQKDVAECNYGMAFSFMAGADSVEVELLSSGIMSMFGTRLVRFVSGMCRTLNEALRGTFVCTIITKSKCIFTVNNTVCQREAIFRCKIFT